MNDTHTKSLFENKKVYVKEQNEKPRCFNGLKKSVLYFQLFKAKEVNIDALKSVIFQPGL